MDSSRSHFISRILVYTLSLHSLLFMGALTNIRTQMTDKNESAFEINGNGLFLIIAIIALLAVEVTSTVLFSTNIPSNYYTILKFVGIFSANFAPFALMLVLNSSPKHDSVLYLLGYVIYAVTLAYVCYGDDAVDKSLNKSSPISVFTYFGLVIVPIAIVLVILVPKDLDWFVYWVLYSSLGTEAVCFFLIYFRFMFMIGRDEPEFQAIQKDDVEGQQKKNNNHL